MKSVQVETRWSFGLQRVCSLLCALALFGSLPGSSTPAGATPSVESFVLCVGGVSRGGPGVSCDTYGVPAPVQAFFNVTGVSVPIDGLAACGIAGDMEDATSAGGPVSRNRLLDSSWPNGLFHGTTHAVGNYGWLSADGNSSFSGDPYVPLVNGAEGFGRCNDTFVITSPDVADGQPGSVRFLVTLTGGLSTTGGGTGSVKLDYQFGPTLSTMFFAQTNGAAGLPGVSSIDNAGISGFSLIPGSMSGSGQPHTFLLSFVFGTPFDFNLGLFAGAQPGIGSVDSHFQAHVSGIEVSNNGGQPVSNFVVVTASGTTYGSGGVSAVNDTPGHGALDPVRLAAAPNPTTGHVQFLFTLPAGATASLAVFNVTGRLVRTLQPDRPTSSAEQSTWWDGRNDAGNSVPPGIYFARMTWAGQTRTTRICVAR